THLVGREKRTRDPDAYEPNAPKPVLGSFGERATGFVRGDASRAAATANGLGKNRGRGGPPTTSSGGAAGASTPRRWATGSRHPGRSGRRRPRGVGRGQG